MIFSELEIYSVREPNLRKIVAVRGKGRLFGKSRLGK